MYADTHCQTTLLIPTHNRPNYLRRLLLFLENLNCRCPIRVYDSSDLNPRTDNAAACRDFSYSLSLQYFHLNLGVIEKFVWALEQANTPFVVFCADDDFVVPRGIHAGTEFLAANALYSSVGGQTAKIFTYGEKDAKIACRLGRTYNLPHDSPLKRCRLNANHWFSTFYNVYHAEILRENLRFTAKHCDFINARIYPEILVDQLGVLAGKVKCLPMLFSVRQFHDGCYGRLPVVHDQSNHERYYRSFQEALASRLVETAGIGQEEALEFVHGLFSHMLRQNSKRSPLVRIKREIERNIRTLIDWLDDRNQLEGCRLPMWHPLRRDPAWQLAYRLIQTYPHGMSHAELAVERGFETSIRRAA